MDAPRLALYARVSSARQREEGTIQSQADALRAYALDLGATVVLDDGQDVFADDGVSGESLDRPALTRLRAAVAGGQVDAVMVYDLDRLSRDQIDMLILVVREWKGMPLFVAKDRRQVDTESVTFGVNNIMAQEERRKIGERAARGGERRARVERRTVGGFAPFGFDMAPCDCGAKARRAHAPDCGEGRLVLNPEEAEWCRRMSRWLLNDGLTLGRIADRLRELQVPTRYEQRQQRRMAQGLPAPLRASGAARPAFTWHRDQVGRILTDPRYAGAWSYQPKHGDPVVLDVPAIFDPATQDAHRVVIGRAKSVRTRHDDGHRHLLRGLIRCGECG